MTHEIARLLREIAYELIAVALPGLSMLAAILLMLHHLDFGQLWIAQFAKDQPWVFVLLGLAVAYGVGQIVQATGHVAIYWLKLPWSVALLLLAAVERAPGLKQLKEKRYFRILDVPNDRTDLEKFKNSDLYQRALRLIAEVSGLPAEKITFAGARDMALALLGPEAAERHKFLNLSELCLGMAGASFLSSVLVLADSFKRHHSHGGVIAMLMGIGSMFILRQPRYFSISEQVVFGQLLIKQGMPQKRNDVPLGTP